MKVNVGEKIQELRTKRHITQAALGEALGVSSQAVSRWETNIGVPEIETLIQIADYFEITLDELLQRRVDKSIDTFRELQDTIASAEDGQVFNRAFKACENIIMGAVAAGLTNEHCVPPDDRNYVSLALRDDGFTMLRKENDGDFFFLIREQDGFVNRINTNIEELSKIFAVFSDKNALQLLILLYARLNKPFTMDYILKLSCMDDDETLRAIDVLVKSGVVVKSGLETADGDITVYSARLSVAFKGLLSFALEFIKPTKVFMARSLSGKKPLLK